ncbi:hypothetical protein Acr_03g0005260 [Actinidia rufa]|uniref:Transmembrane protein n=1 Tax=Actinidia rufa TaxID=165716 RepID=A0A7J0EBR4_9ERIC|nr:hypothetical protein Acr_03g0005260 [Actinidia rufa]
MSQANGNEDDNLSLPEKILKKISERALKIDKSFPSACIYRVPEELRKLKESAYTPRLVSIGPLHSKDERLKSPMQDVKMSYVNLLLCQMTDGSQGRKVAVLEECIKAMKPWVEDAKKSYTEEVNNIDEEMLVVDGCFILELLYTYALINPKENTNEESKENTNETPNEDSSDPVFGSSLIRITVQHDLLLLENQLPFGVLEDLFHITVAKIPNRPLNYSLFDYVISYFSNMMSLDGKSTTSNTTNCSLPSERVLSTNCCLPSECVLSLFGNRMDSENKGVAAKKKSNKMYYHILHILHDHCLPLDPHKGEAYSELMPSASNLDYAGVKFAAGTGQNLFKVQFIEAQSCLWRCFHRARFEIPTLYLYDSTELFLRNLIAFEQCCPGVSSNFTSYAFLMDTLVNSAKDVEVLQKAGILRNYLGADQEASDLFNNLCKEVVLGEFYFAETCKQATKYSECCWPAFVAHVRREYLATPWTFIAFCVAFIAFGMGVAQFILSFLK